MVDDNSIWEFERSLWTGSAEHYRDSIADDCLMVIPKPPYVMSGVKAIEAVSDTPRWSKLDLDEQRIERKGWGRYYRHSLQGGGKPGRSRT